MSSWRLDINHRGSRGRLECPRSSRGRPAGSLGVKELVYRVQGGQGVGLLGPSDI